MHNITYLLLIPALLLILLSAGCDNDGNGSASAQPAPMSGTQAMGTVNAPSEQTCPQAVMIEGLKPMDEVTLTIDSTGATTGQAVITNTTAGTTAACSGMIDGPLPAEIMGCTVSSSTIAGINENDTLDLSVAFTSQTKEIEFANLSGQTGINCAFADLSALSTN